MDFRWEFPPKMVDLNKPNLAGLSLAVLACTMYSLKAILWVSCFPIISISIWPEYRVVEHISKNVHVRYIKHYFVTPGLQTMHPLF